MNLDEFDEFLQTSSNDEIELFIKQYQRDKQNIEMFQTFLADPKCSQQAQIVSSSIILRFLRNSNSIFEIENKFSIADWCQQVLITNSEILIPAAIRTISRIFGIALYSLKDSPNMNEKLNKTADPQMPPLCQLSLLNETVSEFSQVYAGKREYPDFTSNLRTIHKIAINFIKTNDNPEILTLGLQLIYNCLSWGQISDSEELFSNKAFSISVKLKSEIDETIDFLFHIFKEHNTDLALQSLYFIIQTKNSDFRRASTINDLYTNHLSEIVNPDIDINNQSTLLLTQILVKYSEKLSSNDEPFSQSFFTLFENVFNLASKLFDSIDLFKEHDQIYCNIITFFGTLSNIKVSQEEDFAESFHQSLSEILNKYTLFLANLLSIQDPEVIEIVLYDNTMITPYKQWSYSCLNIAILLFMEQIKNSDNQLIFALFLKIVSELLKSNLKNSFANDQIESRSQLFTESINIITMSSQILKSGQMQPLFEYSVLNFIRHFKNYSIFGHLPSQTEIVVLFIVRTIESFQNFSTNPQIISSALDTFEDIIFIDIENNADYPKYKEIMDSFLGNYETLPFFVDEDFDREIKERFIGIVYSIAYKFQNLFVVSQYLNKLGESGNFKALVSNLNGIVDYQHYLSHQNKSERNTSNTFRLIVDFIIEHDMKTFFQQNGFDPDGILLILTFFNNLLKLPRLVQRSETVKFPHHSPNGVVLFDIVFECLAFAINLYIESQNSEAPKEFCIDLLENIASCLAYLLNADYIMFKAFEIYDDPKLGQLLQLTQQLFENVHQISGFKMCIDYPLIFQGFCQLVSSLLSKHFNRCPLPLLIEISQFISFCYQQNQIEMKKVMEMLRESAIKFITQSISLERSDSEELKQGIHESFVSIYGITWEYLLNENEYGENCKLIKNLLLFDNSLLDFFIDRFKIDCVNDEEFLNYMEDFKSNLPALYGPKSLDNQFATRCEFIHDKYLDQTKYFCFFIPPS